MTKREAIKFDGTRESYNAIVKFVGRGKVSGLVYQNVSPWFDIFTQGGFRRIDVGDYVIKTTEEITNTFFSSCSTNDIDLTSTTILK